MTSPPPPAPPDARGAAAAERADRLARIERLAQRRAGVDGSSARAGGPRSTNPTAGSASTMPPLDVGDAGPATPTKTPARGRARRHPAKGARAAALGMSLMSTAGLAGLFALTNRSASADSVDAAAVIVSGADGAVQTQQPATAATATAATATAPTVTGPTATEAPAPPNAGSTATGPTVVDGGVSATKWGPVQVEATFAPDGTLADVTALQTPDDRSKSVAINDRAVPRLTQEALSAQTADVHTISGATYTSNGYRRSLQSAIDAARAAGVTTIA